MERCILDAGAGELFLGLLKVDRAGFAGERIHRLEYAPVYLGEVCEVKIALDRIVMEASQTVEGFDPLDSCKLFLISDIKMVLENRCSRIEIRIVHQAARDRFASTKSRIN